MHIYTQYIHTYAYITTILQENKPVFSASDHIHNVALFVYIFFGHTGNWGKEKNSRDLCTCSCMPYIASVPG